MKEKQTMLTLNQYQTLFPNIARFASDTYQRRSPKGKMVIVRKGKRKNHLATSAGVVVGGLAGLQLSGIRVIKAFEKADLDPQTQGQAAYARYAKLYPGRYAALTVGSLGVIGAGGYLGYKVAKKLTND